jgi:hypothetical protein
MNDLSQDQTQVTRLEKMKRALIKLSEELNDPLNYSEPEVSWKRVSAN